MAIGFRQLKKLRRLFPLQSLGYDYRVSRSYHQSGCLINSFNPCMKSSPYACGNINKNLPNCGCHIHRFSTVSVTCQKPLRKVDLLSFIGSSLDELEGPSHCWLNRAKASNDFSRRDGIFLVLAGAFIEEFSKSESDTFVMFEKIKSLQQRYTSLNVIGFQSSSSICSDALRTRLFEIIMREYITFPILLANKTFPEITDGVCYILFKGLKGPLSLCEKDVDFGILDKAIKELNAQDIEKPGLWHNLKGTWVKTIEAIKEPHLCSPMRNLLLYFPGCIAVDEDNNRLFLSDVNHHRIIVFDGNGMILDCIGSSPGFEDGEFDTSKLMRPAASFYHAAEDCLYFVDSENHAIRRADMERRVVETFYPKPNGYREDSNLWSWIMDKLWTKSDVHTSSEEFDSKAVLFPWHLIKSSDNDLFIFNRSIETLWIMDLASGLIKEVIKGSSQIMEICGQMILEKSSLLQQMPSHWLQQYIATNLSLEGVPFAGLMSSVATFQDHIIICDTVGQMVLKFSRKSGSMSSFQFSNFGVLGLPYWLSFPLESFYAVASGLLGVHIDHIQHFSLLPGRVDIQLNVDIPEDAELLGPLEEGCIWRQARGTATEISGAESREPSLESLEKVGVAQQWYDELDNLASLTQVIESTTEEEITSDGKVQQGRVCINCAVNTSPGTSEVIICAALYLRMKQSPNSCEDTDEKCVARIVDILNPGRNRSIQADPCIQFLSTSKKDMEELVFVRPLYVKLKIDSLDHPKAENSKDIILTQSSMEVNVALK